MIKHEMLLRLFSGDTELLEHFARRIDQRDIAPRPSDPLPLKVALHAYGNFVARQVTADPKRIRDLQQKLLQTHDEQQYEGDPLDLAHC